MGAYFFLVWKKFPVWRELKLHDPCLIPVHVFEFGRSFPFEGNWNTNLTITSSLFIFSLEEVSRLKGIETSHTRSKSSTKSSSLEEVSRLKGIETSLRMFSTICPRSSLEEVSRLKGIETYTPPSLDESPPRRLEEVSRLKGIETRYIDTIKHLLIKFGRSFPFEGNWNPVRSYDPLSLKGLFGRSFPFEGNWNIFCRTPYRSGGWSLEEVSRLKGIETRTNFHFLSCLPRVWKKFPVWRELKLGDWYTFVRRSCFVWKKFPVWRELKRNYLLQSYQTR